MTYGQRNCLYQDCQKQFEAQKLQQYFCSEDCRRKHKNWMANQNRKKRNEESAAELAVLRAHVQGLETLLDSMTESGQANDELKADNIRLKEELDKAQARIADLEAELSRSDEENIALDAKFKALAQEAEDYKTESESDLARARERIKDLEERLTLAGVLA